MHIALGKSTCIGDQVSDSGRDNCTFTVLSDPVAV